MWRREKKAVRCREKHPTYGGGIGRWLVGGNWSSWEGKNLSDDIEELYPFPVPGENSRRDRFVGGRIGSFESSTNGEEKNQNGKRGIRAREIVPETLGGKVEHMRV